MKNLDENRFKRRPAMHMYHVTILFLLSQHPEKSFYIDEEEGEEDSVLSSLPVMQTSSENSKSDRYIAA